MNINELGTTFEVHPCTETELDKIRTWLDITDVEVVTAANAVEASRVVVIQNRHDEVADADILQLAFSNAHDALMFKLTFGKNL